MLVVSDFDGTLSPVNPDPLGARILPLARRALRRLARRAAERPDRLALAVLSGRTVIDVAARVRVGGLRYLGNHGLEAGWLGRGGSPEAIDVSVDEAVAASVDPAGVLGHAVRDRLGAPAWLFVEEKGPSVAFHYRSAADHAAARAAVERALDGALASEASTAAEVLERIDGRRVIEFRPRGAGGKGEAIGRLLEHERPATAVVMGDDRTDAEAFATVRAERDGGRLEALLVGIHGAAETPIEVAERADVMLPGPPAAARLLSAIANALDGEGAGPA
ncbi:MAG TPA: trehalose-phosphatase [Candidatus Limnocylindrales bacterium]|nr:trehalose-phosphatase [Candidatus Limnocylindrales bacterium]